ncbi:unnamed protein product [marine sediment metagenome]|uniref:Uncharacterized protein n=1 Tax=marine sediment metagenome TaxID=412755 RepID=X0VPL5_9ZZZZ
MIEKTRMVVSFIQEDELGPDSLEEISSFLREFGESTDQETVAFTLDGEMYYIDVRARPKGSGASP